MLVTLVLLHGLPDEDSFDMPIVFISEPPADAVFETGSEGVHMVKFDAYTLCDAECINRTEWGSVANETYFSRFMLSIRITERYRTAPVFAHLDHPRGSMYWSQSATIPLPPGVYHVDVSMTDAERNKTSDDRIMFVVKPPFDEDNWCPACLLDLPVLFRARTLWLEGFRLLSRSLAKLDAIDERAYAVAMRALVAAAALRANANSMAEAGGAPGAPCAELEECFQQCPSAGMALADIHRCSVRICFALPRL